MKCRGTVSDVSCHAARSSRTISPSHLIANALDHAAILVLKAGNLGGRRQERLQDELELVEVVAVAVDGVARSVVLRVLDVALRNQAHITK